MTSPLNLRSRVAQHFDKNVSLYTDKYANSYLRMCAERLEQISRYFESDEPIRMLDVGCGAGLFADALLSSYPAATAYCFDLSSGMLARHGLNERKRVLCADAKAIPFAGERFDLINVDAVMHHMIGPGGYAATVSGVSRFLRELRGLANPQGVLAVREIGVEGSIVGALLPRVIFELSRIEGPPTLVTILRNLGIETAGIGVAFLTRRRWTQVFDETGWQVIDVQERLWPSTWKRPGLRAGDLYYLCRRLS